MALTMCFDIEFEEWHLDFAVPKLSYLLRGISSVRLYEAACCKTTFLNAKLAVGMQNIPHPVEGHNQAEIALLSK